MREVCVLAIVGLAISVPIARETSQAVKSFLFEMQPNDPRAMTMAVAILFDRGAGRRLTGRPERRRESTRWSRFAEE